jgi:hypothetical protein
MVESGKIFYPRRPLMKRILSFSNLRLAVEVLLLVALVPLALTGAVSTRAATEADLEAPTAVYWYQCNPTQHVAVFTNRVHVYCSTTTPVGGAPALSPSIFWFAVPTSPDTQFASRIMSLLQTAVITGRAVWLEVNPTDTSGTSYGCGASDCRHVYAVEMR